MAGTRPAVTRGLTMDELAEVEQEVTAIQAAVLYCADVNDENAPADLERLMWTALAEGCPPRTAISVLISAFTVHHAGSE